MASKAANRDLAPSNDDPKKRTASVGSSGNSLDHDQMYDELSRANNELVNAQRDLAQRNARLERIEEQLRQSQAALEERVESRTHELARTLSSLEEQIKVRRLTEEKLRVLTLRLLRLQDDERRKVARDLHDTTGQTLTVLKLTLASLKSLVTQSPATAQLFVDLNEIADQALREIRTTSHLLHPPLLDEAGLVSAARWYIDGFNQRSPMKVNFEVVGTKKLPDSVEIALFRILQESLTNASRHSNSETVDVRLETKDGIATLSIKDYGKGIANDRLERMNSSGSDVGVGIAGMRERVGELHGSFAIQSDSSGTTLTVSVPVA
jgi:two-component system, NarL family, sensor kinase